MSNYDYPRRPTRRYDAAPPRDHTLPLALAIVGVFALFCVWIILGTPQPGVVRTALPTAATYLQNVAAQAPHAPRSAVQPQPAAAPAVAAPAQPQPRPAPAAPAQDAAPAVEVVQPEAVALPAIAPAQATVITARQSNGCADGQVFMPRTGCHTPGSGGAMPGPVGGTK